MVHEFVRIRGEFEFERIRANSNLHPYQFYAGLILSILLVRCQPHYGLFC